VASYYWFGCWLKGYGAHWIRTSDFLPLCSVLTKFDQPSHHTISLDIYMCFNIFKFTLWYGWRGVGPGLSPSPWLHCYPCDSICARRRGSFKTIFIAPVAWTFIMWPYHIFRARVLITNVSPDFICVVMWPHTERARELV
jgi:hypothetical protein